VVIIQIINTFFMALAHENDDIFVFDSFLMSLERKTTKPFTEVS